MVEIWKDVVGFEKYFAISNNGKFFSKRTGKILKQSKSKNGYMLISTRIGGRNGKCYCFKVHRLVAEAFLENQKNKPYVNHIDGNKVNNIHSNLEWCTPQENSIHAHITGLSKTKIGEDASSAKLTEKDVLYIRKNYKPWCKINGARAMSRRLNVAHTEISRVANYKKWKHVK